MSEEQKYVKKTWVKVEAEVEKEIQERLNSLARETIKDVLEGNSSMSQERRNWLAVYAQMVAWKSKCRELHGFLNTDEQLNKRRKAKGIPSKASKARAQKAKQDAKKHKKKRRAIIKNSKK